MTELENNLPKHIGIICDGNRRFARMLNEISWKGHEYGAKKVEEVLDWCTELGIKEVTLWLFSTENLRRPSEEVQVLFRIGEQMARDFMKNPKVHEHKVKLSVIGDISIFPQGLREAAKEALEMTQNYNGLKLNIAAGYGGRQEIMRAIKLVAQKVKEGKLEPEAITPEILEAHMYSANVRDVDLIIRTSGEFRTSGFLLWKSDYAEYYFSEKLWPEFEKADLIKALVSYSERKRRFGK